MSADFIKSDEYPIFHSTGKARSLDGIDAKSHFCQAKITTSVALLEPKLSRPQFTPKWCPKQPLPYDTLRIEQMAVESTSATPAYPYGKIAQTGLAPFCNALNYLKEQPQQPIRRTAVLKLSAFEQQLRDTADHLHWFADRRLNFEYSCALVNQDLAASGRQVSYDLHDCDWVANAAQFKFLMQARCAEGQLRHDLALLKSLCAGVPQYRAELDRHESLGALYSAAQSKQLASGATAFDFSSLPQLPRGKLPPFLTAAESCRLQHNRAH